MTNNSKKITLLLIEDDPSDLFLIKKQFSLITNLYSIKTAESLEEAVKIVKENDLDIILTDLNLPDAKETEVVLKIKALKPELPVIILTGLEDDLIISKLSDLGVHGFLTKDEISPGLIKRVIHYAIDRKQQELALQHLSKIKSDFVSMVSHEIRSPLTYIKEGIMCVLDGSAGALNDQQKNMLSISQNGIDRLRILLDDLLDVTKIEAGQMELNFEVVELEELIAELAKAYESPFAKKGIKLVVNSERVQLNCDRLRIIQIFTNLLGNALKFTETGEVTINVSDQKDRIECSVADTGPGIAPDDLPHLFESFKQFGKKSMQTGVKGSGLGLAIAKELIELHHGTLNVQSELGEGTAFNFSFPK
ncbi:MAG: Sensor histidine kinase RcsC [Chlamydiales bacterium]|nr:Sensor histidine kinase RcsC [Chlamydiales bacterium]MCH9619829.1 Sensor histidine kinase RcsC [Chlamydiales bacterium]MCH9622744.1 Sensor histidine kinase RcsC [Chlamydiales bacterium]